MSIPKDPNRWLKKIDKFLGTVLSLILSFYNLFIGRFFRKPHHDIRNILLIKTIALGDLVLALPSFKAIKEANKNAKVILLTLPRVREVVEGFPWLDEIIYLELPGLKSGLINIFRVIKQLRHRQLDLIVDFEHYYRFTAIIGYFTKAWRRIGFDLSWQGRQLLFTDRVPYLYDQHEILAFFELAKKAGAKKELLTLEKINYSSEDQKKIESSLNQWSYKRERPLVLIHPATSPVAASRRWMPERFAELADRLIEKFQALVIFTGGKDDESLIDGIKGQLKKEAISSAGYLSLKQLAALCEISDIVISVDTGVLHLAAAMGAQVVGLFGPNTPVKWGPYGKDNIAIYHPLECSPCTKQYLGKVSRCQSDECMKAIKVEEVYQSACQALKEKGWPENLENQDQED